MTAVARQHELDPKMVLSWAKQLRHKDLDQLHRSALNQAAFIPSAADYAALEKERETQETYKTLQSQNNNFVKVKNIAGFFLTLSTFQIFWPLQNKTYTFNDYWYFSYLFALPFYSFRQFHFFYTCFQCYLY